MCYCSMVYFHGVLQRKITILVFSLLVGVAPCALAGYGTIHVIVHGTAEGGTTVGILVSDTPPTRCDGGGVNSQTTISGSCGTISAYTLTVDYGIACGASGSSVYLVWRSASHSCWTVFDHWDPTTELDPPFGSCHDGSSMSDEHFAGLVYGGCPTPTATPTNTPTPTATATSTPTPTPTATPTATVAPSPGPNPSVSVPPPSPRPSGTVGASGHVWIDGDDWQTPGPVVFTAMTPGVTPDLSGAIDDLGNKLNEAANKSLAVDVSSWSSASFGTVTTFHIPVGTFLSSMGMHVGDSPSVADDYPVPAIAATIRLIFLWVLAIFFFVITIRTFLSLTV